MDTEKHFQAHTKFQICPVLPSARSCTAPLCLQHDHSAQYLHTSPDSLCVLRVVSMCMHTLDSSWSIMGTIVY